MSGRRDQFFENPEITENRGFCRGRGCGKGGLPVCPQKGRLK